MTDLLNSPVLNGVILLMLVIGGLAFFFWDAPMERNVEVRKTTIGWRRDPHEGKDGQTHVPAEQSPSGKDEYYRVLE